MLKKNFINQPLNSIFKECQSLANITSEKVKKLVLTPLKYPTESIQFNVSSILLGQSSVGYFLIGNPIKIKKDWDQSLLQILKGTYNEVGGDFFKSITQTLAQTLGMKYAFIGEVLDFEVENPMVDTITFWSENEFKQNFNYSLNGSPCEHVIDRKQLIVANNVSKLYPKDIGLAKLGVKSYIGTPIFYKDGTPMGLVVVMDTKPIHISEDQAYKLNLFANRIGTEMEWFKNDLKLSEQERKLRTILKSLPNPVYVQNKKGIYEACNDAFLDFFGLNETDIINQPLGNQPEIISKNNILSATYQQQKTKGINRIETSLIIGLNKTKEAIIIKSPILDTHKIKTGIVGVILDISEMKEAEKILKINEEKYRTLFNKANDAFLLMRNGVFIDCNPKALEMFGCGRNKLVGSTPDRFSPNTQPDKQNSKTKARQKINAAIKGDSLTFYWKHKKYGGELFDAEVSLNAFHIKGELLVQAIVRDVSDKIKATKAIEKQTLRMEKMYELTSDTSTPFKEKVSNILKMATKSLGMQLGGISKIKGKQYKLLDYYSTIPFEAEDVNFLSQTYCSLTIKENKLIAVPNFHNSKYSNIDVFKMLQFESYIGVPYWVRGELRGTILFTSFYNVKEFKSFDSDFVQTIAQWIGASIEREEYEESLRKSEALLGTLLREIPIDFSVRDTKLKMLWQSNKSKEIWGNNEGKAIDFSDVNEESAEKWRDIFNRVLQGETTRGENAVKIYGKPYVLYSIASPIRVHGNVEQIAVIHIDISQLKKAEKKLKLQNTKLVKLNTELDRFVYSASHDLRAPLASLLGLIDLSRREELSPALMEYLSLMNKSITKLDSFISDITDYSRNLRLKAIHEKIDFKQLVNEVFNSLVFMNLEKIDFLLQVKGKFNFYSDPDRLKLILSNLISNSIRYKSKHRKLALKIEVKRERERVKIKVVDNGIGIEKKYQSKIFQMFYRANDQNTGSGLGLFIVKETTDTLNGKIKLESELDRGTTFTILLPNTSS